MTRHKVACRAFALTVGLGAALMTTAHRAGAQSVGAVEWTNLVNATATGSDIQKTGGCGGCADAGGTSRQMIVSADGYAEFTPLFGTRLYAGLGSTANASTDASLIDFAFSFWPDGGWDVRERNVYRTEGRFVAGDVFRVAVVGGAIKYYQNGALVYSSTEPVALSLLLDTTLVGEGAALASATIAGAVLPPPSDPLVITTTTLPDGALNRPYQASLVAAGGGGTYRWTIAGGTLPPDVMLGETGIIAGTPTAAGTYTVTVRAADAADAANSDDQVLTIFIEVPPNAVLVRTTAIARARVGEPYSASLSASGGTGPLVWSIADGSLPDGVTLDAGGTIGGTATMGGRYSFMVRATDSADPANMDHQTLALNVLAAAPPSIYDAISDRTVRVKGALPTLGPAGHTFTDPIFGTRMLRVTDGATRPAAPDRSYRTPSGTHTNAWSADGRYFYVTSTDGNTLPYAFDPATMSASRLPSSTGDGGRMFRFFNEPTFSYVTPGVLYGTYNGSGANLHSVDMYDLAADEYTQLLDLDSLAPNLAGTYTGGLAASAGAVEKIFAFFGGSSQDQHFYLVVFDKENPSNRLLVDTLASTVDGVPTNITLNFRIHAAAIDRSGRYVSIYPRYPDQQPPRSAAPAYVWDTLANTFTATPLIAAHAGGHDAYGYGFRVNQDCCTASASAWDAAQWQLRSLATPLTTADLVVPVLRPEEEFLADHPSWHNAQPDSMVPFLDATYRYGNNTTVWRAWDDEIIGVQTEAAGTGAIVWRFAHHRSAIAHDTDPTRMSFWYTPRVNVSPDGRWALFTSNWEKTLGTDPGGEIGATFRQDVFAVELKGAVAPPPPPVVVQTAALPNGVEGQAYSTTLQASGGSGTFSWSIASGALPAGLSLDAASGAISGTPSTAGNSTFTVRATDSSDPTNAADQTLTISIAAAPTPPVTITTTALPEGKRNILYSANVASSGGRMPLTWSITTGALPPGLAIDAATGTISGRPTDNGTWSFTIRVADSASPATSDTQALSIKIRRR